MAAKSEATSRPAISSLFAAPDGLTKLDKQLTCPKCSDLFTNPKLLPCFHSFCLHCLQQIELVKGNHLPCPTCRSSCPVPDKGLATLPSSFVINNLIEVHGLMKKVSGDQHTSCDNCDMNNIANRYCKQCNQFLCPDCLSVHNKWKSNASHETITLEEVASTAHELLRTQPEDSITNCTEHDAPLTVFCERCLELVCHLCAIKKHKDHDYDAVAGLYEKYRDAINKSSLQPLNQEFSQLTSAKTILDNRIKEIHLQAETTSRSIDGTITEIKKHLDARGKQLKDTISSARDAKVGVLKHQLDELETKIGQVSECQDQLKQSVEVALPHQLLTNKARIMQRSSNVMDSIGNKKKFQPLEQADIVLVKAADIYSKIGDIKFSISSTKASRMAVSPPGSIPNNPSTSGGNPAGTTAGRNSTPVITEPSCSSSGSSRQPLLKPATFIQPFSTPVVSSMTSYTTNSTGASSASSSDKPSDQECHICLEAFKNPKATECCKNLFCSDCLKKALEHSPYCPTCKTPLKPVKGNQPTGTMNSHTSHYQHLPGFEKYGTITITYRFQGGTQGKDHPNPGQPYSGTNRTAYLPDNQEGRHVLKLLRRAFDAGLIFTIGTSATSGQRNVIVWNDISHKTNTHGGSTCYGYPDDAYLRRVQEELKAKGIY